MKKKMRGGLCVWCLAAALLTGCSAKAADGQKKPVVLSVWHYYNGGQQIAFDQMVEEFNETAGREMGIVVECYSQGNVESLVQIVLDAADQKVGAQELPNICSAYADTAYQMYQRGLTADIAPYLSGEERAGYVDSFLEEGTFREGELTIFPIAKATEVLVLDLTDWEPFAQANRLDTGALATYEGLTETARLYYEWTDARQLGFELMQSVEGKAVLNCDKELFRRVWDNYYVPYVKGYLCREGRFGSDDMKTGQVIAYIGSSSGASYVPGEVSVDDNSSYPIETLVLPCPVFEGGEPVAARQGAGMVVLNTGEREVEASAAFLKWFTQEERNVEFAQKAGYMPVTCGERTEERTAMGVASMTEAVSKNMAEVSARMLQEYELYTPKAAEGAEKVRAILENSLASAAKEARAAVAAAVEAGENRAGAQTRHLTGGAFEEWYAQITEELEAAVK